MTSLRAARYAACDMLLPCARIRASSRAQAVLTTIAPPAVRASESGSGGEGSENFATACHRAAAAGTRMMPAMTLPMRAWRWALQLRATTMSRLTAMLRKSTLSANSDTDPMARATPISTKK